MKKYFESLKKIDILQGYEPENVFILGCSIFKFSTFASSFDISNKSLTKLFNRSDFNISEKDFVVVYSGRLNEIKGVEELLCAFNYLLEYPKILSCI